MSLIKHGKRAARKPCRKCGKVVQQDSKGNTIPGSGLYWAHDTDRSGAYCNECQCSGKFTLIEPDGTRHVCDDGSNGHDMPEQAPEHDEPSSDVPSVPVTPTAPVTAPAASPGDPALAAFQAFMSALAPKVDANQVQAIVDERLKGLILPLRIEVVRDGEVHEIKGLSHEAMPEVLAEIQAGLNGPMRTHVMMVGPAGTGKSAIAPQVAEALGLPYYPISCGPTMTESKLLGYMLATGYEGTVFRQAVEHGGVVLFDEVDNANAAVLTVINAALANGEMSFPDGTVKVHEHFIVVCAANTYGNGPDRAYVGRQALDKAFLDRFTMVDVDYDVTLETALCQATGASAEIVAEVTRYVRALRKNATLHKMPVIFGMRAAIGSCQALNAGIAVDKVVTRRIRHGMSDQDWAKVSAGVSPLSI